MTLATMLREFKELPIGLIDEPALPSRSSMDEARMDELVESVRAIGLQQPMIVVRAGERFKVIAGHRRRIACGRAGLVVAPCIIYPSETAALEAIQFAENRFREDLSPTDEAIWFTELLNGKCGGDIEQLAALVHEKISYIDNRLALFAGDSRVFDALAAGKITIGVAHELNKITDPTYCFYYLDNAARCGATISTVRAWVIEWQQMFGAQPPRPAAPESAAGAPVAGPADVNRCVICGKSDHVYNIRYVPMHTHCQLGVLEPLLGQADHAAPDSA